MKVPFFRPKLGEEELKEVEAVLRSGWLTTGPKVAEFESRFKDAVKARHAVAVSSCTAALHIAVEALGLKRGQAVLVPTMTFAATAEIVRYLDAVPVLVDCCPDTLQMDLDDAERKIAALAKGELPVSADPPVGIIPVHVGGALIDLAKIQAFSERHGLWVVEDAAHAFPAAWRRDASSPWQMCGQQSARVSCFSFYANKTITTGEGGMAVTDDAELAERMRVMSLHGLSNDAWKRYSGGRSWDYQIIAPGFKYNLTDIAAAIGIHQVDRAEQMRKERERQALWLCDRFAEQPYFELPVRDPNLLHAWHLFPIRLHLERLSIDRGELIDELRAQGIGCSVHWRPLHAHPYYKETFGWAQESLPVASEQWKRLVSLPIFYGMTDEELDQVATVVLGVCENHAR